MISRKWHSCCHIITNNISSCTMLTKDWVKLKHYLWQTLCLHLSEVNWNSLHRPVSNDFFSNPFIIHKQWIYGLCPLQQHESTINMYRNIKRFLIIVAICTKVNGICQRDYNLRLCFNFLPFSCRLSSHPSKMSTLLASLSYLLFLSYFSCPPS